MRKSIFILILISIIHLNSIEARILELDLNAIRLEYQPKSSHMISAKPGHWDFLSFVYAFHLDIFMASNPKMTGNATSSYLGSMLPQSAEVRQ